MTPNTRPAEMQRITTPELAKAFIDEQIAEVRAQVGNKKVLLARRLAMILMFKSSFHSTYQ